MYSDEYQHAFHYPEYNTTVYGWTLWLLIHQMKVIDLDEPQELFTTSMNIRLEWIDSRIRWNTSDYDGIKMILVRQNMVWSPPLGVFSASEVKDHRDLDFRIVKVLNTGVLSQYSTMRLTTNCGLNMANFPFDIQTCELHLGLSSVNYYLYNISIFLPDSDEEMFCEMSNSAWDVVNISTGSLKLKLTGKSDSRLGVVRVVLKRNPIFYMYMIILPTFTINMIAIGGVFLKKSTQMEKLTIGFTHIMTMTFILGLVSEKIPKTSEIPLLGKYIVFGLCMMIITLVVSSTFDKYCKSGVANRRFNGKKINKRCCVYILQSLNTLAFSYMIYRFLKFESEYGTNRNCDFDNRQKNRSIYSNMSLHNYNTFDSKTGF